jgi:DNA-binding NarL/FixJ family response regulator
VLTVPETIPLSPRQTAIIRLIPKGMTDEQIAKKLGIGTHTVQNHVKIILYKLRVRRRQEAAAKWIEMQSEKYNVP